MNNKINKAVIFDLDGTLLDTVPDILENMNAMLEKFSYRKLDEQLLKKYIGSGAEKLVEDCVGEPLTEAQFHECLDYYNAVYTAAPSDKTVMFDGMAEVLQTLAARGYKLAILTNKPQQTTDTVYQRHLKQFNFSLVIGPSGKIKCKPDKTATLKILSDFNVKPENAYFVGDGETDVLTAINAGCNGISCLWGYRSKEQLAAAGAKVFAEKPSDLLQIIK